MGRSTLLSWMIPDHAASAVEETRKQLFAMTGCISLRALDPMIPIGYIPETIDKSDLPGDIPRPESHVLNEMTIHEQTLFLTGVDTVHLSDTHIHYSVSGEYPIPPFFGIFLGSGDICDYFGQHPQLFEQVRNTLEVTISLAHIQQVQLSYLDPLQWWTDVSFTSEKLKSLRKSPAETDSY